jgi:hypothetical protein
MVRFFLYSSISFWLYCILVCFFVLLRHWREIGPSLTQLFFMLLSC